MSLVKSNKNSQLDRFNSLSDYRGELFSHLEKEFDSFFRSFFSETTLNNLSRDTGYPKMDVWVENGNWYTRFALPGVNKDNIKVEIIPINNNNRSKKLRISGKMSEEFNSEDDSKYTIREIKKSAFTREVLLPDFVEGTPNTDFKEGVLTLNWKIKEEEKQDGIVTVPIP